MLAMLPYATFDDEYLHVALSLVITPRVAPDVVTDEEFTLAFGADASTLKEMFADVLEFPAKSVHVTFMV